MLMLQKVKTLIGITDNTQDELLALIIEMVSGRLCVLLGTDNVPGTMEYIVVEVAINRFNRIGSEGLSSHTVEGESLTFDASDFASYQAEISAYAENNKEVVKGKVRFI